jgi:predicted NBD/HSP70 family sugar kinase
MGRTTASQAKPEPDLVKIADHMAHQPRTPSATPPLLKHLNEQTVLHVLRAEAPISRAEISRRAGISKPTVSLALQSLLDAGLVREVDHDPGGPSYGAVFFEPVPDAALVLGLDLGARFLRGAICDLRGEVQARHDVELRAADAHEALGAVADLRDALVAAAAVDGDLLDGAVVGVPGVVDTQTSRVHMTSVVGLEGMSFALEVEQVLGLQTTVENDINLAALGERWLGVARGVEDFVFLSIGTGLGAGVVLHGELHRGRHGAAGELDLASAGRTDTIDPCADALSALAAERAWDEARTSLAPPYSPPAIFAAARAGDEIARAVVDEEARRIALHVVPVAAVSDVEVVVLGGGIGMNGDLLLGPVRSYLAEWLPFPPRVEVSSLGDAAVLTGALAVGLRAALDNVFVGRPRRAPR